MLNEVECLLLYTLGSCYIRFWRYGVELGLKKEEHCFAVIMEVVGELSWSLGGVYTPLSALESFSSKSGSCDIISLGFYECTVFAPASPERSRRRVKRKTECVMNGISGENPTELWSF